MTKSCGHPLPKSQWKSPRKSTRTWKPHMEKTPLRTAWSRSGLTNSTVARRAFKIMLFQEDCIILTPFSFLFFSFFFFFSFSRSRRLETANRLCLIICNRKTRNIYIFKLSLFPSIDLSRSTHVLTYKCRNYVEHWLLP